ncbi:MAG: UDP-N-acetylglucosamine 1-carboxyvinyltransferase [Bacilli bacterium]|nr:UDP-N-acetylglucosamine 1-carboxyvinyltransferase [Bacilli bacterium]
MKKLIIKGSKELTGEIHIGGAKNSVVALIPATCLTKGKCVIHNVPNISDVAMLIQMMEYLGSKVTYENEVLTIDNKDLKEKPIPTEFSSCLRASYYFMGSLGGHFKHAEISFPGGCTIGARPIDIHLDSFKKQGFKVVEKDGTYTMSALKIKGKDIFFDFPSVGATINVMLSAVLAEGTTRIINAAREPEIGNVAEFLNNMGAMITGAGSAEIVIEGVKELHGAEVTVIPDRIEAGTYIIIGSLLGRNLKISGINKDHLISLTSKLTDAGVKLKLNKDSIVVSKSKNLKAINVKTTFYPGFPTDLGQPMSAFLTQCKGESLFEETIYENRLRHIPYLTTMGANIQSLEKKAVIIGPSQLRGRKVKATDLRAGASLLVAGMIANGTTEVFNVEHLLRGYENVVDKLNDCGADIKLIDD